MRVRFSPSQLSLCFDAPHPCRKSPTRLLQPHAFFSTYAPCFLLSLPTSFHELYDSLYGLFFHPHMSAIYHSYHMISLLSAWSLFFARIEVILHSITSFYSGLLHEMLFRFCLWFQFISSLFSCHSTRSCLINEFLR